MVSLIPLKISRVLIGRCWVRFARIVYEMTYTEDEFLQLSGIQHFAFCRRQWALIHIEEQWAENYRTTDGKILHERAHNPMLNEKRRDIIVTRDMQVFSRTLGAAGKCDVVEFLRDDEHGVSIADRSGHWLCRPVEYKRGRPKEDLCDSLQLCAQAICLEEMLLCPRIETAYLYYGETRHREPVELTQELRDQTCSMFNEMHSYYARSYTPRVKMTKACNACSLKDMCLPKMPKTDQSVSEYMDNELRTDA